MTEETDKEDPVQKFRKLIASFIPLSRLPKKEVKMDEGKTSLSSLPKKDANKGGKLNSLPRKTNTAPKPAGIESPAQVGNANHAPASVPGSGFDSTPGAGTSVWAPRFWTTASVISLTINVIMTIILIILVVSVYRLKLDMAKVMKASGALMDLPSGLYTNFEKMERASIETNVQVNTSIPIKFDLPLNQQTNVILAQDVIVNNATVTIDTGVVAITRANTTIVLPQGLSLPVTLNMMVPVNQEIPVTLNVPVNIALKDTKLNEPFVGLQDAIQPIYCIVRPEAVNMEGQPICQ